MKTLGSNADPGTGKAEPARDESWLQAVVGNLLVRACGLATAIIIARALGPAGRGIVAAAIIWPSVMLSVGAIVNVQTVAYFSARFGKDGLQACIALALLCSIVLLPATLGVNWLALGLGHRASLRAANYYALSVPWSLLAGVFSAALLAEGRVDAYWRTKIFTAAATTAPVFVLGISGTLTIRSYIISAVLAAVAGAIVSAAAQRTSPVVLRVPDRELARSILTFGSKTTFTLLPYQLNLRLDQLVMAAIAPAVVLGPYAVAFAWASVLSMLGSGFSSVVLSRSTKLDVSEATQVARAAHTLRLAFLVLVVFGVVAALTAPIAMPLLFGSEYRSAIAPAIVLCVASIPLYSNLMLHDFLRGIGLPGIGGPPELFGLIVSALGLAILFPRYGAIGAAIVSLLSYSTVFVALVVRLVRVVPHFNARFLLVSRGDFAGLYAIAKDEVVRHVAGILTLATRR